MPQCGMDGHVMLESIFADGSRQVIPDLHGLPIRCCGAHGRDRATRCFHAKQANRPGADVGSASFRRERRMKIRATRVIWLERTGFGTKPQPPASTAFERAPASSWPVMNTT